MERVGALLSWPQMPFVLGPLLTTTPTHHRRALKKQFGLGNTGRAVTALSFTPPNLTKCGSLLCPRGCDGRTKCKGSPYCPQCARGCEDNGKCRN